MATENLEFVHFAAAAIVLIVLISRIGNRKPGGVFKALINGRVFSKDCAADRMFEKQQIVASKKCPNCAEPLPLSAIICEACDYNFLSGMVGYSNRLLAAPEPRPRQMAKPSFAYRG
jgi:hypothetical protein